MRAREFVRRNIGEDHTVNIPITITIPSDDNAPVIVHQNNVASQDTPQDDTPQDDTLNNAMLTKAPQMQIEPAIQNAMPDEMNGDPELEKMIPPLQQELELEKADAGKDSEVINQLMQDDDELERNQNTPLAYK